MDKQTAKITDLRSLQAEKERLRILAGKQQAVVQDDLAFVKSKLTPMELLNTLSTKIVPAVIRHSPIVNNPINYLAQAIFKKDHDVVDRRSDQGTGNRNRNIALGLVEGVGTWLLAKYAKKRLSRREREED
jgi:hypothetical protein